MIGRKQLLPLFMVMVITAGGTTNGFLYLLRETLLFLPSTFVVTADHKENAA
jgi:hypothetical protein